MKLNKNESKTETILFHIMKLFIIGVIVSLLLLVFGVL